MNEPIVIVGAGLSGLHAASLLVSQGISCIVLEAQGRIGGRVLSGNVTDKPTLGKFDLGPTWFWPQHEPVISGLVENFGLKTLVQHTEGAVLLEQSEKSPIQRSLLPEGAVESSVRLIGGMRTLVDAVVATLHPDTVKLDTRVTEVQMDKEGMITLSAQLADGKEKKIQASAVILALPPRIIAHHIAFSPSLPEKLMTNLMDKPTWMAGQAKAIAVYERPFWREEGLSGQAMSWIGPLQEIHDASPETGSGALFGFFGLPAKMRHKLGEASLRKLVLNQLTRLYGTSAEKPISFLYKDWSTDLEIALEDDANPLNSFPNYGRPTSTGLWEKKVVFAGTETSSEYGGHLEGALRSAERAVMEITELGKTH